MQTCAHGYLAMTCPACNGAKAPLAPPVERQGFGAQVPQTSGFVQEEEGVIPGDIMGDIINRTERKVTDSSHRSNLYVPPAAD